jgi:hypothetical protein
MKTLTIREKRRMKTDLQTTSSPKGKKSSEKRATA